MRNCTGFRIILAQKSKKAPKKSDSVFRKKCLTDLPLEERAAFMKEFTLFIEHKLDEENEKFMIDLIYQILEDKN